MRKKSSQIASLERQLDDKVCEVTEHVSKVTELEEELTLKVSHLQKVRCQLDERGRNVMQHDAMLDKMRQLHSEQCQEMENQIDMVRNTPIQI